MTIPTWVHIRHAILRKISGLCEWHKQQENRCIASVLLLLGGTLEKNRIPSAVGDEKARTAERRWNACVVGILKKFADLSPHISVQTPIIFTKPEALDAETSGASGLTYSLRDPVLSDEISDGAFAPSELCGGAFIWQDQNPLPLSVLLFCISYEARKFFLTFWL